MTRRRRIARILDRFARFCFQPDRIVDWDYLDAYIQQLAEEDQP